MDDWEAVNYTIIAWIFNTIESRLRSSISYRETSFDLWEDIRRRFSIANGIKVYQLQCDLADCKQKSGESLMDYFGRIKMLWDDINDYDALPTCDCCLQCDLQGVIRKRRDAEQVRGFLMGLDPVYATVRSSILGTSPLPDIHIVYSRIAQEEEVRTVAQAREEAVTQMACAVTGKGQQAKTEGNTRPRFKYAHCNKDGHTVSRCWEEHGFPVGHPRHVAKTGDSSTSTFAAKTNAIFGETPVVANVVRLSGKLPFTWIIDTGTSTYVCYNEELFDSCVNIAPVNIGLPTGARVTATKAGTIKLNDKLSIFNVLFVPSFTCNLFSVSQMLSTQNLCVKFTNAQCMIEDHALTTIGVGDLLDGLFYLTMMKPTRVNAVTGEESAALWHLRMGHPSSRNIYSRDKFDSRSRRCIIIGYPFGKKGWHLYDLETGDYFQSRDVHFIEDQIPFATPENSSENPAIHEGVFEPNYIIVPSSSSTQNVEARETGSPSTESAHDIARTEIGMSMSDASNGDNQVDMSTNDMSTDNIDNKKDAPSDTTHAITNDTEPNSFKEAICDPKWKQAMEEEIAALEANNTWSIVDLPSNKTAIGWIDFAETFAPTVKMVTVRTFLTIAAINNWELHQMDVQNAFLHGDLEEEVYMRLPLGFGHGLRGKDDIVINILVYVDDLVIAGNNSVAIQEFKNYLSQCFRMKDLETGLLGSKPAPVPMEEKHDLALHVEPLFSEPTKYRRLVGKLIYLTLTRSEITYLVHILSQFMQAPSKAYWDAVVRVVRYLKGNPGQGILLRADTSMLIPKIFFLVMPPRRNPAVNITQEELDQLLAENEALKAKRMDPAKMSTIVARHNPTIFTGEGEPHLLGDWCREFTNLFELIACPEECK
ncbi:uncharacterized protein LOC141630896 [Silene latifolia]|uniref:uncharacterized protein LOC141630896 n=1 Tax=Silene latifolia TaxID=37657 RepID=UPI003D789A85